MPVKPKPLSYTTKTQALSDHLARLARRLGPGARLPTMQQLSEELGISVMTLNRALSELEAQGILVRRQGSGTYVTEELTSQSLGLVYDRDVFGPEASQFCSLLLHEIGRLTEESGLKLSLYLTSEGALPADLSGALRGRRLAGLLFAGESDPAALSAIVRQKVPLVALSHAPIAPFRVSLDHTQTAFLGAQALAAKGCKRIALWIPNGVGIGPEAGATGFKELERFQDALKEAGLPYDARLVSNLSQLTAGVPSAPVQGNREQGRAAVRAVFDPAKREAWPDGIVSLDDEFTRGALVEFYQQGLVVGRDVSIASHSNKGSTALYGFNEAMTILEFDPAQIAAQMLELLKQVQASDDAPEVVVVEPQLRAKPKDKS